MKLVKLMRSGTAVIDWLRSTDGFLGILSSEK